MMSGVEILLVEDNPEDVEITLRAFQKHHLTNKVHVVRDGEEALECLFGTGPLCRVQCPRGTPFDFIGSEVTESRRAGGVTEMQSRSAHEDHTRLWS